MVMYFRINKDKINKQLNVMNLITYLLKMLKTII